MYFRKRENDPRGSCEMHEGKDEQQNLVNLNKNCSSITKRIITMCGILKEWNFCATWLINGIGVIKQSKISGVLVNV